MRMAEREGFRVLNQPYDIAALASALERAFSRKAGCPNRARAATQR